MLARNDLIELRAIRRELIGIEIDLRFMQLTQVLRKFNPDQPRVPAGNPDGGQWTSDGAGAGTETDKPQDDDEAQILLVNDRAGRFRNDLLIHEMRTDAHTIKEHVGKSEEYMLRRVQGFQADPDVSRFTSGSFSSLESANRLVNSVMDTHSDVVNEVAAGIRPGAALAVEFDSVTGREAFAATRNATPYMRETYSVRVVIKHDPASPFGYWIHTAFPSNR